MLENNPDIFLSYQDDLPGDIFAEFIDEISTSGLKLEEMPREDEGPNAGLEWLLFPIAFVYLTKPYFEGFLQEAGRDHYQILKGATHKLSQKFFGSNPEVKASLIGTPGKLNKERPEYSVAFSIFVELPSNRRVRLMILQNSSDEELNSALEAFFDLIERYHNGEEGLSIDLDSEKDYWGNILITYSKESQSLMTLNPLTNIVNRDGET